jgi:hypothetical protein
MSLLPRPDPIWCSREGPTVRIRLPPPERVCRPLVPLDKRNLPTRVLSVCAEIEAEPKTVLLRLGRWSRGTWYDHHELGARADRLPRQNQTGIQTREIGFALSRHFRSSGRRSKLPHKPIVDWIDHCHPSLRALLHGPKSSIYSRKDKSSSKL